jgi:hypothetical protein
MIGERAIKRLKRCLTWQQTSHKPEVAGSHQREAGRLNRTQEVAGSSPASSMEDLQKQASVFWIEYGERLFESRRSRRGEFGMHLGASSLLILLKTDGSRVSGRDYPLGVPRQQSEQELRSATGCNDAAP